MRTFDPLLLSEISRENLSDLIRDPRNYALVNDDGGFFLHHALDGSFEIHTLFPPGVSPRKVVRFAHECQEYMFTQTPCVQMYTQCPDNNPGALHLSLLMGLEEVTYIDNGWKPGVGLTVLLLTLDRWRHLCSTGREAGKAFRTVGIKSSLQGSLCR